MENIKISTYLNEAENSSYHNMESMKISQEPEMNSYQMENVKQIKYLKRGRDALIPNGKYEISKYLNEAQKPSHYNMKK